ncbi:HYC_CC_PP family protein, partial [Salmonella enterica]|uniref:HYC_CC_PP family protein n=1 Tax=Salmonella enterica TaxID=28901 RepID=UPI003D2A256A
MFLLIYANVGLATAVNLHFCNGHISKVSLIKGGLHKICCCKTKSMTNSCCKDEVLLSKSDSHQVQTTTILPELNFKILTLPA